MKNYLTFRPIAPVVLSRSDLDLADNILRKCICRHVLQILITNGFIGEIFGKIPRGGVIWLKIVHDE